MQNKPHAKVYHSGGPASHAILGIGKTVFPFIFYGALSDRNCPMSLAQRSIRSVTWTTVTTLVAVPINLLQTILLARLLPVEYFGIFAGVTALLGLTGTLSEFGLTNAFLHRSPETEDEDQALSVFFALRLLFETIWAAVILLIGWFSFTGLRFYVLVTMVAISYLLKLTLAPRTLLVRRVMHKRLALLDFIRMIFGSGCWVCARRM